MEVVLPSWTPCYKVTQPFDHLVLLDHMTNLNHHTFNITISMNVRVDRMVTYFERLLPIKWHGPLSPWSCKLLLIGNDSMENYVGKFY